MDCGQVGQILHISDKVDLHSSAAAGTMAKNWCSMLF
jgi:hypothetical protein